MESSPKDSGIEVIWREKITSLDDIPEAVAVRKNVFIDEQKIPAELEFDDLDLKCPHLIILKDKVPVATARLVHKEDKWYYSRIATIKEYRGKGIGRIIVEELGKKAKEAGAKEIYLESQVTALGFYEKFGFESYGEVFILDGLDHKMMKKTL